MKRRYVFFLILAVLIIPLALSACAPQQNEPELEEELSALKEENRVLQEQVEELQKAIEEAEEKDGIPLEELDPNMWSREGLEKHIDAFIMRKRQEQWDFEPGTTDWRPSEVQVPTRFTDTEEGGWETPGLLLHDFTGTFGSIEMLGESTWQVSSRVFREGPDSPEAVGILMFWGLKDDSTGGLDYLVSMEEIEGRWIITDVKERFHCLRGVTEDGLCI